MYLCDKGSILVLPIEYVKKNNKRKDVYYEFEKQKNNKRKDVYYEFEKQKNL